MTDPDLIQLFIEPLRSSFSASAAGVQRDMKVEGLFGNRGMLIEDTDAIVQDLDARAARVLTLIGEALSR